MAEPLPIKRPWRLWSDLKALAAPLGVYSISLIGSLGLFTAVILVVIADNDEKAVPVLALFWLTATAATAVGQGLAIARIRTSYVFGAAITLFVGSLVAATRFDELVAMLGDPWGPMLVVCAMLGAFFLMCGLWSLRVQTGVLAAWGPVIFATSSILLLAEDLGNTDQWFAGQKHAIWDLTTGAILAVSVILLISFLAGKEFHRLHHWRTSVHAPDLPMQRRTRGWLNPLNGCGTLAMLFGLSVILTLDSGVVAPYLWRTGPGDSGGDPTDQGPSTPKPEPQPQPSPQPLEPADEGPAIDVEQIVEAAKRAGGAACMLMTLVLLAVLTLVVFGPPTRRVVLLRHLRTPFWPVQPTRRVRLNWRLVEIALADYGIVRKPGESAVALMKRALPELPPDLNLEPLEVCAEATDRVIYGYGLSPEDGERVRRAADMAYEAIWERLSERDKLRATYRLV